MSPSEARVVLENLANVADAILIGGAMANTFLVAQGYKLGASKYEADKTQLARTFIEKFKHSKVEILLPVDHGVVGASFLFWGFTGLFTGIYAFLFVAHAVLLVALFTQWFRELS